MVPNEGLYALDDVQGIHLFQRVNVVSVLSASQFGINFHIYLEAGVYRSLIVPLFCY